MTLYTYCEPSKPINTAPLADAFHFALLAARSAAKRER